MTSRVHNICCILIKIYFVVIHVLGIAPVAYDKKLNKIRTKIKSTLILIVSAVITGVSSVALIYILSTKPAFLQFEDHYIFVVNLVVIPFIEFLSFLILCAQCIFRNRLAAIFNEFRSILQNVPRQLRTKNIFTTASLRLLTIKVLLDLCLIYSDLGFIYNSLQGPGMTFLDKFNTVVLVYTWAIPFMVTDIVFAVLVVTSALFDRLTLRLQIILKEPKYTDRNIMQKYPQLHCLTKLIEAYTTIFNFLKKFFWLLQFQLCLMLLQAFLITFYTGYLIYVSYHEQNQFSIPELMYWIVIYFETGILVLVAELCLQKAQMPVKVLLPKLLSSRNFTNQTEIFIFRQLLLEPKISLFGLFEINNVLMIAFFSSSVSNIIVIVQLKESMTNADS